MQFSHSLKGNRQFRRIYARGRSMADRYLVLYCRGNGSRENCLGLTVSAKLGCAVKRNRLRRQLRECYRTHEQEFLPGYNIIIVARTRAMHSSYQELERSLLSLADKQGLLRKTRPDA